MYNLVLKDLLIQKKNLLLGAVYNVFFIFVMQYMGFLIYPAAITAFSHMLVVTACSYDDKNKADVMLNSLPLKRSNIVLAKYISIFIYATIGTIIYLATIPFISIIGFPIHVYPISVEGLAGTLFSISLFNSIYFPFYFKYGYIKSQFLSLFFFFIFIPGNLITVDFIMKYRDTFWIKNIYYFFKSLTDTEILVLTVGSILVILASSFEISLKVYKNRDL